jgi:hypothetical protein
MSIGFGDISALMSGGAVSSLGAYVPGAPVYGTETVLDKEILPEVVEILNEYGKILNYYMYPSYSYDETTGKGTEGASSIINAKSIPPYEVKLEYVDGDLVQVGDMLTGVAGLDIEFTPDLGIEVKFDGQTWRVVRYEPIYSGERIALYLFQLRK